MIPTGSTPQQQQPFPSAGGKRLGKEEAGDEEEKEAEDPIAFLKKN